MVELVTGLLREVGWLIFGTTVGKFVLIALLFTLPLAAVLTWMERRQSAYSQDRYGPQRAHFLTLFGRPIVLFGLLHILADSLKMFFKEPFTPSAADRTVFRIAPMIGFVTALLTLALIPFGPDFVAGTETYQLQVARIDTGILIVFAIGSLGIYGAALAGWASNNRFALLGGLRASAQTISYEIALGLTVVGILIAYGSTELADIVGAQAGLAVGFLPNWGIIVQPVGAVLFFTAAMAETKRAPFDLPEAESEILGYFLEYSSMGFGLFMLSEFIEVVVLAALFVTIFLGGWQMPMLLSESAVHLGPWLTITNPWVYGIVGVLVFALKTFFICVLQLQIRWTLPRFRYDQLMRLGWKSLLPLSLVNIFVTAGLVWWDPSLELLKIFGVVAIILFILVVIAGPRRLPSSPAAAPAAHGH